MSAARPQVNIMEPHVTALNHPIFYIHKPFVGLTFAPNSVIARKCKVRIKNSRVVDDLVSIQDNAVSQMLTSNIEWRKCRIW